MRFDGLTLLWKAKAVFKKILLTTDLSELSMKAFAPALELARRFDATILLAHIGEFQIPPLYVEYTGFQFKDMIDEHQGRAREEEDHAVAMFGHRSDTARGVGPRG